LGTAASDWLWFFLGKFSGRKWADRNFRWRKNSRKARVWINKYPVLILFGYRYLYGIRTVIPLVIGMSHIPVWKFLAFSTVSILIWTMSFGVTFLFLTDWFTSNMEMLKTVQTGIVFGVIALILISGSIIRFRQMKSAS
jgi:membrane protein DedA with SNARE-associated domain